VIFTSKFESFYDNLSGPSEREKQLQPTRSNGKYRQKTPQDNKNIPLVFQAQAGQNINHEIHSELFLRIHR
jgi:hypothetical protein